MFQLAAVLVTAVFLMRLSRRSALRLSVSALAFLMLVTEWNRETFPTARPIETYDRWAGRAIEVDKSCESFFVKRGSSSYSSRSDHKWTLYSVDAMFVSLRHSLPTLNGYSAWFPDGWDLFNPEEAEYDGRVRRWIERHHLRNVCELDIEARTIRPVDTGVGLAR